MQETKECLLGGCTETFEGPVNRLFCSTKHRDRAKDCRRRGIPCSLSPAPRKKDSRNPAEAPIVTCALPGCSNQFPKIIFNKIYCSKRCRHWANDDLKLIEHGTTPQVRQFDAEGRRVLAKKKCELEECQVFFDVFTLTKRFCCNQHQDIFYKHQHSGPKYKKEIEGRGPREEAATYEQFCRLRGYHKESRTYDDWSLIDA